MIRRRLLPPQNRRARTDGDGDDEGVDDDSFDDGDDDDGADAE